MSDDTATTPPVETAPTVVEKYPLTHIGHGKFEVNGKKFNTKKKAQEYVEQLLALDAEDDLLGDILPKGIKIQDRVLEFRGSVMEVPMNEMYLPNGDINPMYDRAWVYAWAGFNGTDIADRQARGYHIFTHEDLQEMLKSGKAPEHYASLLRRDGQYMVYGDLILMRIPRVLWRQRLAEKHQRDLATFSRLEREQRDNADRLNMPVVSTGHSNEVTIRL